MTAASCFPISCLQTDLDKGARKILEEIFRQLRFIIYTHPKNTLIYEKYNKNNY